MKKRQLGQFNTTKSTWLLPHIVQFIKDTKATIAYDPFAGNGDILKQAAVCGLTETIGLDIDKSLNWKVNDSLANIPPVQNAVILTNPPYLAKYRATRHKLSDGLEEAFNKHTDLYQVALRKALKAQKYVVAIIPETFITSSYAQRVQERLASVTVLLDNPFTDTEHPVCVACFDGCFFNYRPIPVYVNEDFIGDIRSFWVERLIPTNEYPMTFNSQQGNIALRCIDLTDDRRISFFAVSDLDYDVERIKETSRHITIIDVEYLRDKPQLVDSVIKQSNAILDKYRRTTYDVNLSAFKGNRADGKRRRRLDYRQARTIIELAIIRTLPKKED